jgi:hypothetical protein
VVGVVFCGAGKKKERHQKNISQNLTRSSTPVTFHQIHKLQFFRLASLLIVGCKIIATFHFHHPCLHSFLLNKNPLLAIMSDQSYRELNSRWKDLQSAHYSSSPHLVQQSSADHSSYQINHNHGDYRTNHNYSNHHGLSTSQLGNQIIQFPTPQPASGDFVSRPNPQQQYQSNNPQLPPSTSTAIPPSNSQNLPNVTPKKRPAPRVKPHVRLGELFKLFFTLFDAVYKVFIFLYFMQVPNHIRNREDEANQKRREIQQASICSSAAPAPTGSLAAPAPAVDDSHDVSDENDEDAHGEEDSDLDCNHTTQFDFDIPELSPSPNFPPPLFIASPPSQNLRPEVEEGVDQVDHSKLQSMFGLDPEQAEMGRIILKACFFQFLTQAATLTSIWFVDVPCKQGSRPGIFSPISPTEGKFHSHPDR